MAELTRAEKRNLRLRDHVLANQVVDEVIKDNDTEAVNDDAEEVEDAGETIIANMNKVELITMLEELGVEFNKKATVGVLREKLEEVLISAEV